MYHALYLGGVHDDFTYFEFTNTEDTRVGGERAVRELMEILSLTARQIVNLKLARYDKGSHGGAPRSSPAREIAEAVMGRIAWDIRGYRNLEYKRMTGSRRPEGSNAVEKHVSSRNKKLGGSMSGWSLECEL